MTDHAPDLDVTHARQARRGRHAFVILVVSLTAAIAAVFGAWAGWSGAFSRLHYRETPPAVAGTAPAPVRQTPNDPVR